MNTQPKHTKHLLHAFLTLLFAGIWLPIWIWRSVSNKIHNSRAGFSSDQSTSPSLFHLLRIIRGFCGLVFALQLIYIIEAVLWLFAPEAVGVDMGKFFALLLLKAIYLAVAGFLFFWLRGLVNRLYTKKHGIPHPALAVKQWAL